MPHQQHRMTLDAMNLVASPQITNFGGNVLFRPRHLFVPESEDDVLALLQRFRNHQIRVVGRLHAWSDAARGDDVVLDLRKLNGVRTVRRADLRSLPDRVGEIAEYWRS